MAFSLPGIARAEKTTTSSGPQADEAVIVDRDARQGRPRLALRAGRQAQNVLRRVVRHVGIADLHARRHAQRREPLRDLRVLDKAAADEGNLAVELHRQVHQELHAVDARGEHADHQLARCAGEQLLEGVDDFDLGPGEARAVDVGAVGEQRQHAACAKLGQAMQVEVLTVNRRLIDLEVARVDDGADRRRDGEGHAVRHTVRDSDELDRERANRDRLARLDDLQSIAHIDAVFFELWFDERQRHRRSIDRAVEVWQHVRYRTDVIFVAVGEDERLDLVPPRLEVGEIGNDQVDAELIGIREHDSGVNEDRGVLPGHRHHVHPELAEPAQRDDLERVWRHGR